MELGGFEGELQCEPNRFGGVSAAVMSFIDVVAERCVLPRPARHIGQRNPPDELVVLLQEDAEGVTGIALRVSASALDLFALALESEVTRRLERFPRFEEPLVACPDIEQSGGIARRQRAQVNVYVYLLM